MVPFIAFGLWIQCREKQIWNVLSRVISLFFILRILFGSPVSPPSLPSVPAGVFLGQLCTGENQPCLGVRAGSENQLRAGGREF